MFFLARISINVNLTYPRDNFHCFSVHIWTLFCRKLDGFGVVRVPQKCSVLLRKERISCFFVLHGFSFFILDLVDCLHQRFNIQAGVDTFGECHSTRVSRNLLDHGLVYMALCQHGNAGMPGTVWHLVISKLLHPGCEVTVVVVPVIKVLLIWRVEQKFTQRTFVPCFVEWQYLVGNGDFPQAVFRFFWQSHQSTVLSDIRFPSSSRGTPRCGNR